jgi:hypothetical protein
MSNKPSSTKEDVKFSIPHNIYEALGWVGVVFVLGGYCLLATGIINSSSWHYHVLILFGSLFLGVISYIKHNYQPVVLNAFFILFAIIALIRLTFN